MRAMTNLLVSGGAPTPVIPDGKTVTPTDDIQILLACASITDKVYTSLAELLADSTTLLAVINSNNAIDYMKRSTSWAETGSVPQMTGYTTPEGEVIYSNEFSSKYLAWYAFDRGAYGQWEPSGVAGNYIGYKFPTKVSVFRFNYQGATGQYATWSMKNFKLQGSNDGSTWTDIQSYTYTSLGNIQTFNLTTPSDPYQYFRLYCIDGNGGSDACATEVQFYYQGITTSSTAMTYIGLNNYASNTLLSDSTWRSAICVSDHIESVLNVKVPTMTSNTTPSGTCVASNENTSYPAWKAFDKLNNTFAVSNNVTDYIGYLFTSSVKVYGLIVTNRSDTTGVNPITMKVQGSNDGSTWTDVSDVLTNSTGQGVTTSFNFSNTTSYLGYCIRGITSQTYTFQLAEIQFYGRRDV